MKTFRLLIVALLLAGTASAQRMERRALRGDYSPTVYLISVRETDTLLRQHDGLRRSTASP